MTLSPDHPDVGQSLNNIARLYTAQGRYADAEPLLKRSLAIRKRHSVPIIPISHAAERFGDALSTPKVTMPRRSRCISGPWRLREGARSRSPTVAPALNNLAALYQATNFTLVFHQAADEVDVTRQSIEKGDGERRLVLLAEGQRPCQFRLLGFVSGLHLGELRELQLHVPPSR